MFKKFNYQLNHSPVGVIWGISFSMLLGCLFIWSINGTFLMPKDEVIKIILGYGMIANLIVATYILFKGEIKQVNVTYVCPTARKYMNEQELLKIEIRE